MPDMPAVRPFGVQFGEAIDFLKGKLSETSQKWDDLAGPVHAKVFTIAGTTNIDLVNDIHTSLKNALANGTTITQFRKDFDAAVQKHGWTYKGKRGWRTSVIFNTNMRTAHMAGRWKQIVANLDNQPYLQYRTAGDARVRPQHRQWNGLIFPAHDKNGATHPFWQTHYPPNGWGCRCTVRAFSQAEMTEKALALSPKFEGKTRTLTGKDGAVKDAVPVGIDPGWDHNVGQSWIAPEAALGQKLAALPRPLQGPLIDKTISPAFEAVMSTNFKAFRAATKAAGQAKGDSQIVGFLDSGIVNAVAASKPELEFKSFAVAVRDARFDHLEGDHKKARPDAKGKGRRAKGAPQQIWPSEWMDSLPEHLRNYQAVFWDIRRATLIVVPQGSFHGVTVPKITIRPNQGTRQGPSSTVIALGSARPADLNNPVEYQLLLGRVIEP